MMNKPDFEPHTETTKCTSIKIDEGALVEALGRVEELIQVAARKAVHKSEKDRKEATDRAIKEIREGLHFSALSFSFNQAYKDYLKALKEYRTTPEKEKNKRRKRRQICLYYYAHLVFVAYIERVPISEKPPLLDA